MCRSINHLVLVGMIHLCALAMMAAAEKITEKSTTPVVETPRIDAGWREEAKILPASGEQVVQFDVKDNFVVYATEEVVPTQKMGVSFDRAYLFSLTGKNKGSSVQLGSEISSRVAFSPVKGTIIVLGSSSCRTFDLTGKLLKRYEHLRITAPDFGVVLKPRQVDRVVYYIQLPYKSIVRSRSSNHKAVKWYSSTGPVGEGVQRSVLDDVAVSGDGRHVFMMGGGTLHCVKTINTLRVGSEVEKRWTDVPQGGFTPHIAVSWDGKWAVVCSDGVAHIYSQESDKVVRSIPLPIAEGGFAVVRSLDFQPASDSTLVAVSYDKRSTRDYPQEVTSAIVLLDVTSAEGKFLTFDEGHRVVPVECKWLNEEVLISFGQDGVRTWDLDGNMEDVSRDKTKKLEVSLDGKAFATLNEEGAVILYKRSLSTTTAAAQ